MTKQLAVKILDEMFRSARAEAMAAFERGEFHRELIWAGSTRAIGVRIPQKFRTDVEIIANNSEWRRKPVPSPVVSNQKGVIR